MEYQDLIICTCTCNSHNLPGLFAIERVRRKYTLLTAENERIYKSFPVPWLCIFGPVHEPLWFFQSEAGPKHTLYREGEVTEEPGRDEGCARSVPKLHLLTSHIVCPRN